MTKPPLGLVPTVIWESQVRIRRIKDIEEAIKRYKDVDREYPRSWDDELHKLREEFNRESRRARIDDAAARGANEHGWRTNTRNYANARGTVYDGGANGWF